MSKIITYLKTYFLKSSLKVKTKRGVLIKIRKLLIEDKLSVHYFGNLLTFDRLFLVFSMTPTIK